MDVDTQVAAEYALLVAEDELAAALAFVFSPTPQMREAREQYRRAVRACHGR